MKNKLHFSTNARKQLAAGVRQLADAVTSTLGPNGRNVLIQAEMGAPSSTKDGVTVAKSINLEDEVQNMAAELIKQASLKTADQAGDGTTTSTLLAAELYLTALDQLSKDVNAVEVKRGMEKALNKVLSFIREEAREVIEETELKQVATISGNNDEEVGNLVYQALDKVGTDGVVSVEESRTGETYLETVEGIQFNRGYKSPFFVKDNSSMTATLKDALILLTDQKITQAKTLLPLLEQCSSQNKPLVIIADDIDGEALSVLVVNKQRGALDVVAVKAPEFGDRKLQTLEDIAVLTGGSVINKDRGMRLDRIESEWLGTASKVTVGKETTTIVDGKGESSAIEERIIEIKSLIDNSTSPFEIESLQDRLARMAGGVAMIHCGGNTEVEMKEKKDRIEDALHATKAAIAEGVLPGGGIALLRFASRLEDLLLEGTNGYTHEDQLLGVNILIKAMQAPFNKILTNAGYDPEGTEKIAFNLLDQDFWRGFNPRVEKEVDMYTEGIIDPAKVTRLALENAVSVAGTMLITECVVSNIQEEGSSNSAEDPGMLFG
jgi:chaperonin GroEL